MAKKFVVPEWTPEEQQAFTDHLQEAHEAARKRFSVQRPPGVIPSPDMMIKRLEERLTELERRLAKLETQHG